MIDFTDSTWFYDNAKLQFRKRKLGFDHKMSIGLFNEAYELNMMNFSLNEERYKIQSELDHEAPEHYFGHNHD